MEMDKIRSFITIALSIVLFYQCSVTAQTSGTETIKLDKPPESLGIDIMVALKNRKSTKAYEKRDIPIENLATVLWAGNGINRDNGKRTAPTPKAQYFLKIFVLGQNRNFLYNPVEHSLIEVSKKDIKSAIGVQPFVADAPYVIVLVADLKAYLPEDPREKIISWAHVTAGCIAQNMYLAAAALNLGTVIVASFHPDVAIDGLGLSQDQIPLYIMPLGIPKN